MKKKTAFNRIVAFFLSVWLSFAVAISASASEDYMTSKVFLQCWNNTDLKCTILILTFNSIFTEISNCPQAKLAVGDIEQTISTDRIICERNTHGAQMFIRLPTYLSDEDETAIPSSAILSVPAGIFYTSGGEESPAVIEPLQYSASSYTTRSWEQMHNVFGGKTLMLQSYFYEDKKMPVLGYLEAREIKIVEGTDIELQSLNWAWNIEDITFSEKGMQIEKSFTAQGCGKHTISGKVNDYLYDTISFTVITKEEARNDNLRILGKLNLRSLYIVPCGLVLQLLIGYGNILGAMMLYAQWGFTKDFFKQISSDELVGLMEVIIK